MPLLSDLAVILVAHRGPLPTPARQFVVDLTTVQVAQPTGWETLLGAGTLSRADVTTDEARRIYTSYAGTDTRVHAAWLARPEHDPTQLPDILAQAAAALATPDATDALVRAVLHHRLCRPNVRQVLRAAYPQVVEYTARTVTHRAAPASGTSEENVELDDIRATSISRLADRFGVQRVIAADHLVTSLGDNPDAWRVLFGTVEHLRRDATLADVITVATAVARPAVGAPLTTRHEVDHVPGRGRQLATGTTAQHPAAGTVQGCPS